MKATVIALLSVWVASVVAAKPAFAAADRPTIRFNAGAGYQYDSNVNVADLDTNTGEADNALLLGLGLEAKFPLGNRLSFTAGYGYDSTTYQAFSDFDLAIHHLQAVANYKLAGFDTAVTLDHVSARLDGDSYLDATQVAPSLARLFGERLYLRGSIVGAEKSYTANEARKADNDALRADAYILFDGMQRYLALSHVRDSEDALASEFDYDGMRSKLTYGHRLEIGRAKVDLKTHLQFENRDYPEVTDSSGAPRRDERLRAGLCAAVPLSQRLELRGEAEYANNRSNLAAADFDETVYSLNIGASF